MLTGGCIHPEIMRVLSLCGHGDKILIADGNYPLHSKSGAAEKVWLGVSPGLPSVTDVLAAIQTVVAVERAEVMSPGDGPQPLIFGAFQAMLGGMALEALDREAFYQAGSADSVRLAISTGETRVFANLLLTVGVT